MAKQNGTTATVESEAQRRTRETHYGVIYRVGFRYHDSVPSDAQLTIDQIVNGLRGYADSLVCKDAEGNDEPCAMTYEANSTGYTITFEGKSFAAKRGPSVPAAWKAAANHPDVLRAMDDKGMSDEERAAVIARVILLNSSVR